ncbi:sulfotransferase family protein [Tamilnaduibacter salinus]|uniref:Sulfotransferase family protein n=1 Tax=Tamilnaduibacter salinus TaxID=1484056 RepID=A0A2U1CZU2_9GAMM|nr:sulfotransferase family 2 domain-containing protein [Tamilnaduibacter salinus]PVY78308.1 sulfotransferase family protein [Tamilnaduibacter salinus]
MENHSFIKFVPGVYVIYLSIPKVASSSISHAMMVRQPTANEAMSEHSREGKALTNWRPASAPHPSLPIFTFTRHPIRKFLSYYKDKFVRARGRGFELDHLRDLKFDPEMSLEEVIEHMMTIPVERMEHHAQPQHRIVLKDGELIPDFIGQVETLADDWPVVEALSLSEFTIDGKKNVTGSNDDLSGVSDAALSALTRYYEEDFELFGYEKPECADDTVAVRKAKRPLSSEELERLRLDIEDRRRRMVNLSRDLEDDDFRAEYARSMQDAFNDYLIHANKASQKRCPSRRRALRSMKRALVNS